MPGPANWVETASNSDAIAAISSPPGSAARGIVRISGDAAFRIVNERLIEGKLTARRGVQSVRIGIKVSGEKVDVPALALVMVAPQSFTGQETVELLFAGHTTLLTAVVNTLCDSAFGTICARRASPGEFSARAFLSGTLEVEEAESIALSISAESDSQLDAARQLRSGRVRQIAFKAAEEIIGLLALVEAGIDFSDQEDVVAITAVDLVRGIASVQADLSAAVNQTTPEESLRALPVIALRGAPNAGKSCLFNALLGHERVVTSPQAGSTRDAIIETLKLNRGREVLLVDLPGIEDPHHALGEQMQELAKHAFDSATLQLNCVPISTDATVMSGARMMTVWTKSDCADDQSHTRAKVQGGCITSALNGDGIDELREALTAAVDDGGWVGGSRLAPVLLERHRSALAEAQSLMAQARDAAQACVDAGRRAAEPAEIIAMELRDALDALGIVAGHRTPDDVLAALFARFCIGK